MSDAKQAQSSGRPLATTDGTDSPPTALRQQRQPLFPRGLRVPGRTWSTPSQIALITVVSLLVAGLVLYPLANLLYGSFLSQSPARPGGVLTLDQWSEVYGSARYFTVVVHTFMVAVPVVLLASLIGSLLAWINTRTDTPGVRWFEVGMVASVLLSPLVGALAWMAIGSPNAGLFNSLTQLLFDASPMNILSWPGVYFVMTLDFVPYAYLLSVAALRSTEPSLEEASKTLGGSTWVTARRITMPLTAPAILGAMLLVFVLAAESFAVPATLGRAAGITTLPYAIYREINTVPANWPRAAVLGTILLAITVLSLLLYRRLIRNSRRFVGITGRAGRTAVNKIGRLRYLGVAANVTYLVLAFVIPYSALVLSSLLQYPTAQLTRDLFTTAHYESLLRPEIVASFRNTALVSVVSATAVVALAIIVVLIAYRTKIPGRTQLDNVSMLPIAVPGTVFAIAMLWAYFRVPWPIYGTAMILVLAYWATYLPIAVRSVTGSLLQIDLSLEEAGRSLGAGRIRTWWQITLPLMRGASLYAWLFVVALVVREVSTAVILSSSGVRMLSVQIWSNLDSGHSTRAAAVGVLQTAVIVILGLLVLMAARIVKRGALKWGSGRSAQG